VGCESACTNPPVVDGLPASGVRLSAGGQVQWTDGNLGDIPVETIDYRTYSAEGWTIVAAEDGTRFTNDGTRHGMFISVSRVEASDPRTRQGEPDDVQEPTAQQERAVPVTTMRGSDLTSPPLRD
jgi:hypothetical protein